MGKVRVRKETNKLFIDFRFQNHRCREQTLLDDSPNNRRKLETMLKRMEAEMVLGQFDYAKYFRASPMAQKLRQQNSLVARHFAQAPLFADFVETWYDEAHVAWRESYRASIRGVIDRRLLQAFGEKGVDHITKADLLQFRAQLAKVVRKNGKGLSAWHINRHMKVLRMILNEAADRFEFTSPYRGIKQLKVQKSDIDPFTLEEINLILDTVRPDFRDYYCVRFFTGMRTGEIDGLQWRFVDFDKRQILVRETIVNGRKEYTKTDGSQREIAMAQPVYEALLRQRDATGAHDYVFCNRNGNPISHNNITRRVWYPLLRYLELEPRRPYQTRHTAATLWLASGESPEWIARQMGHANTEMLFRVYSRYVPNLTRQDGSAFERLLASTLESTSAAGEVSHEH
ncbi:tyrosine-type recombinase/integrase [Aestuariirhabdus sp. LZHN29]|uniref:tyrosine-type recombinase/integrase n=1 Tax=Aestuariirhabdus sp. LZHN29 TaxID=3417462 RepID=UPI003CEB79C5